MKPTPQDRERIAIVSTQFLPRMGGAEMQALKLAQSLLARGHDARIFTLRFDDRWAREEVIGGVPVTRTGGVRWGGRLQLGQFLKWITFFTLAAALWRARKNYDIIHATTISPWGGTAALVGILLGKPVFMRCGNTGPEAGDPVQEGMDVWLYPGTPQPDRPWAFVPHATWVGGDISNLKKAYPLSGRLALAALRNPHVHPLATTSRMHNYLARELRMPPDRVWQLPNVVAIPRERDAILAIPLTVMSVMRFTYEKGIDVLLHAWVLVRQEVPDARLRLVGAGRQLSAMRQLAGALDLGDSVEFLGERYDIDEQLRTAAVFALSSRWEGSPNALLEAMSLGLPCVSTRVSGAEDVIQDGVTGLLVPCLDHEALAQAIVRFLRDPDLAARCGAAARDLIESTHSADIVIERYLDLCAAARGLPRQTSARVDPVGSKGQ